MYLAPLLLLLIACPKQAPTAATQTGPLPTDPLPVDPGVRQGVLDNGMRWYVEVNDEPEKRAVFRLAVNAGSVLEDDDQLGVAHFVEHMAFNGSEHFAGNELITYLESVGTQFGAHLNAHTSVDETVYKLMVPTDDPAVFDKAFVVFQDWAGGLTFDGTEIDKERGVVLEEWRSRRGAGDRIGDLMRPLTMGGSRYVDRKTIGTEESLKTFTHDAARRFYTDWYRPDLMAIIVVGDIDPDYTEQKIKEHFSGLKMPAEPRERTVYDIPSHDEVRVAVIADPELPRTGVGIAHQFDDPEVATHGAYREGLVDQLIARMVNERLRDISQLPEAPFLGANTGTGRMTPTEAIMSVSAATDEAGALEGLRAIATEIARVRRHGFTSGELDRARDAELKEYEAYWNERETTHSQTHAEEIVRVFLIGESMPGIEAEWELARTWLPQITLDEVDARAKAHWMPDDSRVVTVTLPEKEGLAPPTEAEVRAVLDEVAAADIPPLDDKRFDGPLVATPPQPGTITARREIPELGATVWTLSNGATVWVKPTDFKVDQVLLRSSSPGGFAKLPDERYVPATTATALMGRSGLGDWDATDLGKALAGKNANVSPWIGSHHEGVSGSASPDDLETLFELAWLSFTAPRFDEDAFQVDKRGRTEALRNRDSDPNTKFNDTWDHLMWSDHPRHLPWTVETLEKMSLDASRAVYQERFADASDFTFVIVGNVDLATLEPLVTRWLAALPGTARDDAPGDDGARRAKGVLTDTVTGGIEPKARFSMEIHGPFEGGFQERTELYALREILSVRLRKELREELGGVYGVGVSGSTWELPERGYRLGIGFGCDPERVAELEAATMKVLGGMLAGGVEASEVDDVKAKNRRGHETNLRDNGWWASAIEGAIRRGEDPMELLSYEARNESLSVDTLNAAAKRWINLDQYVRLVLLPEDAGTK